MAKEFAFEMCLWYVEMWGILCVQFLDVFKVLEKKNEALFGNVCWHVKKKLY